MRPQERFVKSMTGLLKDQRVGQPISGEIIDILDYLVASVPDGRLIDLTEFVIGKLVTWDASIWEVTFKKFDIADKADWRLLWVAGYQKSDVSDWIDHVDLAGHVSEIRELVGRDPDLEDGVDLWAIMGQYRVGDPKSLKNFIERIKRESAR